MQLILTNGILSPLEIPASQNCVWFVPRFFSLFILARGTLLPISYTESTSSRRITGAAISLLCSSLGDHCKQHKKVVVKSTKKKTHKKSSVSKSAFEHYYQNTMVSNPTFKFFSTRWLKFGQSLFFASCKNELHDCQVCSSDNLVLHTRKDTYFTQNNNLVCIFE